MVTKKGLRYVLGATPAVESVSLRSKLAVQFSGEAPQSNFKLKFGSAYHFVILFDCAFF